MVVTPFISKIRHLLFLVKRAKQGTAKKSLGEAAKCSCRWVLYSQVCLFNETNGDTSRLSCKPFAACHIHCFRHEEMLFSFLSP